METSVLKRLVKKSSASALYYGGLLALFGRFSTRNLTVLALHRVVTDEEWSRSLYKPMMVTTSQFRSLLELLDRSYHPIALSDAVQRIRAGYKFRPGTVAITFDDGYLDVYQNAYPLLREHNIPATVFLTTGVVDDHDRYLWWDEIDHFCRGDMSTLPALDESYPPALSTALELMKRLPEERSTAMEARIRAILLATPAKERMRLIELIRRTRPPVPGREPLMLNWDQVREMSGLIEYSNHTVSHQLLDELDGPAIEREVITARQTIERETGQACHGFAYPGGAYNATVTDVARRCGVEYAVTTRFSNNSDKADLLRLDRKDVGYLYIDNRIHPAYFKVVISGIMDWFRWITPDNPSWASRPAANPRLQGGSDAPLIVHVIYQLAVGGLENGLVNLINRLPHERYRHAIVSLKDYTDFRNRITNPNVDVYVMHKRPGKDLALYGKLWRRFRQLKPDIVHTRNLTTLESQLPAWLAGVPFRVHGEHGRDIHDLDGTNRKYQLLRRVFRPLIHRYIALSLDLKSYLRKRVGVPEDKITHICNGVDTGRFHPRELADRTALPEGFAGEQMIVLGTVGRMEPVKDQLTLVKAFIRLLTDHPGERERLRLVMVGDGALRAPAVSLLEEAGMQELAWLPGERDNVPDLLRSMDIFILPSLAEGISNTILEAMASGLPVVATHVGGNSELVAEGETGFLVPRDNPVALAEAVQRYLTDTDLRIRHGDNARRRCENHFSIDVMVRYYQDIYDGLLGMPADLASAGEAVRD